MSQRLSDFFDRVICINLDRRKDRWQSMQEAFACVDDPVKLERLSGVEVEYTGNRSFDGLLGCVLSHRRAVEIAIRDGAKSVLVFEDDVEFVPDAGPRIGAALEQIARLPWRLLYLGMIPVGPILHEPPHLVRLSHAVTMHAIGYHWKVYDHVLRALPEHDQAVEWLRRYKSNDRYFANYIVPRWQSYCIWPQVAFQKSDYSDISQAVVKDRDRDSLSTADRHFWQASAKPWWLCRRFAYRAVGMPAKHVHRWIKYGWMKSAKIIALVAEGR